MTKTVLASKFQEWKGLDRISLIVHEMKCIFREITKDDFGLDGEIEVVRPKADGRGYETTGGIIKVQAKSGDSYVKQDTEESFITPVQKSDLECWYNAPYPVFLIVYHPKDNKLYYKEIQSYVLKTKAIFQAPLHIRFDKSCDEFGPDSFNCVAQAACVSPPRVSHDQREQLYSNLLVVKRGPKSISYAPTSFKTFAEIRKSMPGFLPPFTILGGRIYTFADLIDERCPLRNFCDLTKVETVPAERWSNDEANQREYVFLLNQLLGSHLRRCGLVYSRDFQRNYFPRENDVEKVFREDWYNVRTGRSAPPRIVAKYYQYGLTKFWRHLAANFSFKRIGTSWFLQVVPKYFFTEDGETPCPNDVVGPYTTGVKAVERNLHLLNHVLFWSDVISMRQPVIKLSLYYKTLVTIEKRPLSGIANFAIVDDAAIYEVDEGQSDLLAPISREVESEGTDEYYV